MNDPEGQEGLRQHEHATAKSRLNPSALEDEDMGA